jgi:hypothetical protein
MANETFSKKFIREPLVHFFALGLLLFILYGFASDNSELAADEIVISQSRLSGLLANFEKTWQRSPTADERENLIDSWVREEILYREGVAIGFDRDDPVIRRRVAQKMTFVAEGLVPQAPDDAELEAWLQENIDEYQIPAIYSFRQIYIDPQRHESDLDFLLSNMRTRLNESDDAQGLGDSTMLPFELESASSIEVSRAFGIDFVRALAELEVSNWQGPVTSGYGLHFVKIDERISARIPVLDEVRAMVERDVLSDKSKQINEAFYASLRERYSVRIESPQPEED